MGVIICIHCKAKIRNPPKLVHHEI